METGLIHVVGDGLAGSFLARALTVHRADVLQYGDGKTNTPPVGFVHLFQGRTFHRDPLELIAFRKTVEFWRARSSAREWVVEREVAPGDRLYKSADTTSVPQEFRPQKLGECSFCYSPGFTVETGPLLQEAVVAEHVDPKKLQGVVVHATGLRIAELLPDLRWDNNPGRTVSAGGPVLPQRLYLKRGCHLGADPTGQTMTIGGRVNSRGEAKNDETELASEILSETVEYRSQWWGERIANALDRWPVLGWLDDKNFVFGGFGGRALFWLPYCTEIAVKALEQKNNAHIPEKLRVTRF